jgi:pimeloyl-ACP methyl ester carboxylesterase
VAEELQIRIHNPDARPTLIYFPGLHGDWTLIGGFREAIGNRVRFVEITYPRTLTWTLDDYAIAIEEALFKAEISEGWLLGESFGSQVVWPLLKCNRFKAQGVILAGGFARHPTILGVRFAEKMAGAIPLKLIVFILFGYARIARWRFRKSPATLASINEFIARRTTLDKQAAQHRLQLLSVTDPCDCVKSTRVPVYALSGLIDPIVPWVAVRPWFRKNCPALRDYKIITKADHNVLGSAPQTSAEQVLRWISGGT